jgi:maleylpyruvate isomerase
MNSPYLARIGTATERLLVTVSALDDVAAAEPSLLPNWDRAMVVTHLAGNAEGIRRAVVAASLGGTGEVYPGGRPARDAEIEAGRGGPALELELRLRTACEQLSAVLAEAPDQVRDALALHPTGEVRVGDLIVARLREVEVHHVDLNCAYAPGDWPFAWVLEEMDRAMLSLPTRLPPDVAVVLGSTDTDQHWVAGSGDVVEIAGTTAQLFAWVTGRATQVAGEECPPLKPWR